MWFNLFRRKRRRPDDRPSIAEPARSDAIHFGPLWLSADVATNHFLFAGTTGSGKTTNLRRLRQSTYARIGTGVDTRAIVYDAKQDIVPQLAAIAPAADLVITHPLDARCVAWDLAADIREPQTAVELAFNLIPHVPESQPFFSDAARHLLFGVTTSFILSGQDWTLADLIRAFATVKTLKGVLRKHDATRDLIPQYLYDQRLAANILSTVATKFLPFGPLAAAWEHAQRRVSLTQWAKSEMIWVLGNSEISRHSIQTLNRCMFKRAVDLTLNESESTTRRNWFDIDELADVGRLEGLVSLAKKGRSKGGCLAIAFQSVDGLRDAQMYGPHCSSEVLAQFGHKFIGRLECAASAEWASLLVGDQEIEQTSTSETRSAHGQSTTKSRQMVVRRGMLPSQIMDFPPCNIENGLTGMFFVPTVGTFQDTIDGHELFRQTLIPPDPRVPAFVPRPVDCQYLRRWSPEQAARFSAPPRRRATDRPEQAKRRDQVRRDDLDDLFQ